MTKRRSISVLVLCALAASALVACSTSPATQATGTSAAAPGDASSSSSGDAPASGSVGSSTEGGAPAASAADVEYDFPTGDPILIYEGYPHPTDRVDRTGAYLPVNDMPTFVIVEAIWCPLCGLVRPVLQELRPEYQDRVNFVILDYDTSQDASLARDLGVWAHPGFGTIAPDSNEVINRYFGPLTEERLREILDGLAAQY